MSESWTLKVLLQLGPWEPLEALAEVVTSYQYNMRLEDLFLLGDSVPKPR
jgi:hypothetical protein